MIGMALPGYRANIATDLKIVAGTEMSVVELNRAVQRAVNDLSRYFPLEHVYEETLDFTVTDEGVTTPATASATAIVNAQTLDGVVSGDVVTIADNTPDVPRRLTVTLTDANASVTALTIIVKGYDSDGYYIEESWNLKDLPSGTAVQGRQYFKYVSDVEVDNIAGTAVGDTISVGTGNAYDSYVFLANKPIKPESETVTSSPAGTTYTRDTDYTIDYTNGAIKFINGGSMAAGTAYLIDYTKSKLGINISSLLPIVTRITKVQYPADLIPQQFVSFNIVGDFMYVASKQAGQSQESLTNKEHLVIWYERMHTSPGEVGPGSYPSVLDEVVIIGASGYALLTEAQQYEQQAATDLAALRTELGLTTGIHTLADAALDKVVTYLENNTNEDSKYWLTKITTDAADLRTAIESAVDAIATNLGKVFTSSLDKATTGAEAYLDTGDDTINLLNVGSRVGEIYADYTRARTDIATTRINASMAYAQEATIRLSNLRSYLEQAAGWKGIAETFIVEAQSRIGEIQSHLQEANQWAEAVNGDLVLADRFRAEGLNRLGEFHAILRNKSESRRRTSSIPTKQPA